MRPDWCHSISTLVPHYLNVGATLMYGDYHWTNRSMFCLRTYPCAILSSASLHFGNIVNGVVCTAGSITVFPMARHENEPLATSRRVMVLVDAVTSRVSSTCCKMVAEVTCISTSSCRFGATIYGC
ncbi:hypothetical protein TNCV_3607461 [Trichonephila clavipes]|nr:hypothetical protein TNCV_3607461 [Trichonephila clavipes]